MFSPYRIKMKVQSHYLLMLGIALILLACGGDSGSDSGTSITSFELLDPTPLAGELFGTIVIILPNGNIIVTDPNDSSIAASSGAVHLYNPFTQTLVASIYGDVANDRLGSNGITALTNNNYVIASAGDDVGGIVNAGSVRLMNGTTGMQIGNTIAGDIANDQLGVRITALANNNYVITSTLDNEGGITNASSVRLVDGTTGVQIGSTIAGDVTGDQLGSKSIIALANNNYVIVSPYDDEGGIVDAGSVQLVNGITGAQIGGTIAGDVASDRLGFSGITPLANNNYVIASPNDDEGGIVDAGSVQLVNGTTGAQIGSTLAGDVASDWLGNKSITALANNNYVIASEVDDEGGIVNAGSVRLVDGTTGAQIGSTLAGDVTDDRLGNNGITALANNNYVIASPGDDEGGIANAGSVRLVNGTTGIQIGSTLAGDVTNDALGSSVTALGNNNYVAASYVDDVGVIIDAGSVRLMDGTTGVQIGSTIAGDVASDALGYSGITALANNNYVIASSVDNESGNTSAGSVRLVNGTTGVQIGSTIAGDVAFDKLGSNGVTALSNNNFVIASQYDQEGGIFSAGSVRLVDGTTGAQIGSTIAGDAINDGLGLGSITTLTNSNYFVVSPNDDEGGIFDAGSARMVNGANGAQIGSTIVGSVTNDMLGAKVVGSDSGDYFILSLINADNNSMINSGLVRLIAQ